MRWTTVARALTVPTVAGLVILGCGGSGSSTSTTGTTSGGGGIGGGFSNTPDASYDFPAYKAVMSDGTEFYMQVLVKDGRIGGTAYIFEAGAHGATNNVLTASVNGTYSGAAVTLDLVDDHNVEGLSLHFTGSFGWSDSFVLSTPGYAAEGYKPTTLTFLRFTAPRSLRVNRAAVSQMLVSNAGLYPAITLGTTISTTDDTPQCRSFDDAADPTTTLSIYKSSWGNGWIWFDVLNGPVPAYRIWLPGTIDGPISTQNYLADSRFADANGQNWAPLTGKIQ